MIAPALSTLAETRRAFVGEWGRTVDPEARHEPCGVAGGERGARCGGSTMLHAAVGEGGREGGMGGGPGADADEVVARDASIIGGNAAASCSWLALISA
jgi:hypothetical protein